VFQKKLAKLEHSPKWTDTIEPTCEEQGYTPGSYCQNCNQILDGMKSIDPTGHTEVIDPAVPSKDGKPGRTEGKHCETCGLVIVKQITLFSGEYSNPEKYHSDYAFRSLSKLENGDAMQEYYAEIDALASDFHNSLNDAKTKKNGETEVYYLAEIVYADNGLTLDEAMAVYRAYVIDHPIYYWLSNEMSYSSNHLTIMVADEYIDGEMRESINITLYEIVEEYVSALEGRGDAYQIALAFHDMIIENADYAFDVNGNPSIEKSAHDILGVLLFGEGVCESYSKAFQLLLNYCGVENIYVTGYSGEPHSWNLVMMDDGEWYWCDLTWDDQPGWMLGVRHNYFCVTDNTLVNWLDGKSGRNTRFLDDHIPESAGGLGVDYSYSLPERAEDEYDYDGFALRDEIIVIDGLSYVLMGFGEVALIDVDKAGRVVIPEKISVNGFDYRVTMISEYDEKNHIFTPGSIFDFDLLLGVHVDVSSLFIPKTVEFIWDFAFDYCYTIESFEVDEENPAFTSLNGVLFTKSLYTLIKYPLASPVTSYTVPTSTVEIVYGSFGDGGNLFRPKHLSRLVIPGNVDVIGAVNGGYGFRNKKPESFSDVSMISGYLDRLRLMLGFGLEIK
jgi:hypothetical protein